MELKHFLNFLDAQFEDCENSIFCNAACIRNELPGFKAFVVKFMLKMSKVSQVRMRNLTFKSKYYTLAMCVYKIHVYIYDLICRNPTSCSLFYLTESEMMQCVYVHG